MPAPGVSAAARCGASILAPRRVRRLVQLVRSASASGEVEMDTAAEREKETYLETASRPSRFQESQWGPEDVCTVLLEAMRVQWSHGYPHTPRGYPRTTHGFHEYPAGMQAAAADRILDVLPGDSLLDPFTGGGTSLVVGMTKGRRTVGIDVSPLAAFVATHRTWRPGVGAEEETFEWMRATAARVVDGLDDAAKAVRDEDADAKAAKESESEKGSAEGDDGTHGVREGAKKGGGVPRAWRAARRSLASALDDPTAPQPPSPGLGGSTPAGALWFCLSVALQRSQKGRGKKKRGYKNQRQRTKKDFEVAIETGAAIEAEVECALSFQKCVDEYCDRVGELCEHTPGSTPAPVIVNGDVRSVSEAVLDGSVTSALTSPPYPGVYDYLSFARKVRAGSGAALVDGPDGGGSSGGAGSDSQETTDDANRHGTLRYFATAVPDDRNWPTDWNSGEFGSRRELRQDPRAFKDVWQEDQRAWLGVVSRALVPGGRAAVMIGDGANVDTRQSTIDAGAVVGLTHVASVSMALTHDMADGGVWNAARREHLVLLEKTA